MRAPVQLYSGLSNLNKPDIGMIGVPFDGGVTNRPGARHGPREVRNQSSMCRMIHEEFRINPHEMCKVYDLGDVEIEKIFNIQFAHEDIRNFYKTLRNFNIIPLSIGGDHSITAPILDGFLKEDEEPVGLIHLDAHCDTWDEIWGSDIHHGAPFRKLLEWGKIDKDRVVQIGIRGGQNITQSWDYSEKNFRVIYMHEFINRTVPDVVAEVREIMGDRKTYISFDIDAICPSYAPGTGTPEFGGLTPREAIQLLRGFRGLNLIGADLVEVSPSFDQTGGTAQLGAHMMYEMLCLLADSKESHKP